MKKRIRPVIRLAYTAKVSWDAVAGAKSYEIRPLTKDTTRKDSFFQIKSACAVDGDSTSYEISASYFKFNGIGVSNTYRVSVIANN